jgi:hypothetical protein
LAKCIRSAQPPFATGFDARCFSPGRSKLLRNARTMSCMRLGR